MSTRIVVLVIVGAALAVAGGLAGSVLAAERQLRELSEEEIRKLEEVLPEAAAVKPQRPRKVLIFWRCEGFFHGDAILWGNKAFELMGKKTGAYTSVASDDLAMFEPERLKEFDAVIFNNTTSLRMENEAHREALLDFVRGGKGIVGSHSATDNFYKWPEGAAMMGALFAGHPWGEAPVKLDDPTHPLVKVFEGKGFWFRDEMYRFRDPYSRERLRVLLSFDMSKLPPDAPSRDDKDNAIAWIQEFGKGRVFYCSFGHDGRIFRDPRILRFYLDGIQYALGDLKADATPSAKLSPQPKPALPPEKGK
jgi:type 1 glutamine amidotransferase